MALLIAVSYFALIRWFLLWLDKHVYVFSQLPQQSLSRVIFEWVGWAFVISVPLIYYGIHSYALGLLLPVSPLVERLSLCMPFVVLLPFIVWWGLKNLRIGF